MLNAALSWVLREPVTSPEHLQHFAELSKVNTKALWTKNKVNSELWKEH